MEQLQKRRRQSNGEEYELVIPRVDVDEIVSYIPTDCFYLREDDPISHYNLFQLASILLSLYGKAPEWMIEAVREKLGIEPIKYDTSNPVHVAVLFYYRHPLYHVCKKCVFRGECPWWTVIKYLNTRLKK